MSNASILVPNDFDIHSKKLNATGLIAVASPNDANAATAGVPIWGLYRDATTGAVYIRTS